MSALRAYLTDDQFDDLAGEPAVGRPIELLNDNSWVGAGFCGLGLEEPTLDYADLDISERRTERDRRRARLIAAVRSMQKFAPSWDGEPTRVSPESALAAELFLACLPESRPLPKVGADGEGDVMFVWEYPDQTYVVTVEPKAVHLVAGVGSPDVHHVNAKPFYGAHVPLEILRHLPMK